jgi:hypothetical protein
MAPVISLLTALERQDVDVLNELIEHDGMIEENFTYEEAAALWDAGWQDWLGGGRDGNASWQAGEERDELRHEPWESDYDSRDSQISLQSPQLWYITLGVFLRWLHATFPELPGAPAWVELRDVEEE